MKIAILGAGHVGSTLGKSFIKAKHEVFWGVRDPEKDEYRRLAKSTRGKGHVEKVDQAVRDADIVVLATPWDQTQSAIQEAHDLTGKVLVDCTNAMKDDFSGTKVGCDTSCAEIIATWAPGAKVVKSFNEVGYNVMAHPAFRGNSAVDLICGDDENAKKITMKLAKEIGFNPVNAGPLRLSRQVEQMALLWVNLAYNAHLGRDFAFGILKKGGKQKSE
jgi:8-hydroxy-5-deazaflavin:NADPH oxidoreductase